MEMRKRAEKRKDGRREGGREGATGLALITII